jgi:chromosome segregation ATPase
MDLQDQQQRTGEENAKLQATLKSVQGEASAQKSAATSASRKVRTLSAQVQDLSKQRDGLTTQVADLQKQLTELKAVSEDQAQKLAALDTAHQALQRAQAQCVTDNAQLYTLGGELLKHYENKGFGDVLAVKEPFTQIARVKLETLGQSYRDKLDDLRVQGQPTSGPAAQP